MSYQDTCDEILEKILDLNCSECHAKINKMLNTNMTSLLSRSSNDKYFSQGNRPYANANFDSYIGRQNESIMYLAPSNDVHGVTPTPSHPGTHLQGGDPDGTRPETPCVIISHEALEIIKGLVIGFLLILVVHMILKHSS